jgi:hypothetical protein
MACGHWHHAEWDGDEKQGGGLGVAAYQGIGETGVSWFPLDESSQQPFTPDELASMEWAWLSRSLGDGNWEGVAVKGTPRATWATGIIPHYEDAGAGQE